MLDIIAGLPLHPLVVHATEVIVPSAALVVALAVSGVFLAAETVVEAVRIGHSGATAPWSQVTGSGTQSPTGGSEND